MFHKLRMGLEKGAFSFDLDPMVISPDMAISYGLLLNELLTNALKYAVQKYPRTIFPLTNFPVNVPFRESLSPFYSLPIECTDRDAPYVLDGLLYNESDLSLEEHYTDTHGYTEINFAAFAMLGRRFSPRIKGMRQQRKRAFSHEWP